MDAKEVKKVAVIGAGIMGHGIAQVFAQTGIETGLVDLKTDILERADRLIRMNLRTLAAEGIVDEHDLPAIMKRIRMTTDLDEAVRDADFVLEAVAEIPDVKKAIFLKLDQICRKDAIFASNTSSLDIFAIAGDVARRDRLIVAHWFAPPQIIPLVEIAPGPETSSQTVSFTSDLMKRIGKRPVVMKDFAPGFIVNRIQQYIGLAAMEIISKGWATPEDIDLAVKTSLGIRLPIVGVLQTFDFTGLDVVAHVLKSSLGQVPPFIADRVEKGEFGAKTSKGIYDYGGRTEEEILEKRDRMYLAVLAQLKKMRAFEPV